MKRIALVAAVLAGLAGSGVAAPAPAQAACAFVVVWQDRAYADFDGGPLQLSGGGRALDGAVQPGCNDTAGADERPTRVNAKSIPGVFARRGDLGRGAFAARIRLSG
jgi:hypothetical protein